MRESEKSMSISELASLINDRLKPVNKLKEFKLQEFYAKTDRLSNILQANKLTELQTIAKALDWKSKLEIATSKIETINSIAQNHKNLLDESQRLSSLATVKNSITQINNLQFALEKVSGQLALFALKQNQFNLSSEYKEISQQTIELAQNIDSNEELSDINKEKINLLILTILSFAQRNKRIAIYSLLIIDILLRGASIHQYYDFLKTKPELATKDDLLKSENDLIKKIEFILKEQKEFRTTNRICKLRLKPNKNSYVLAVIPKNFEVIVLQVKNKWIYVSYINEFDNLPQSGWVLKKYLEKSKK